MNRKRRQAMPMNRKRRQAMKDGVKYKKERRTIRGTPLGPPVLGPRGLRIAEPGGGRMDCDHFQIGGALPGIGQWPPPPPTITNAPRPFPISFDPVPPAQFRLALPIEPGT